MVPIALGTLGAACGSDTTNPLTAPAEVAEQGIARIALPLAEAAAAHAYIESRAAVGRVLLIP